MRKNVQTRKLSESYSVKDGPSSCLEMEAVVLNVNLGHNQELMERSSEEEHIASEKELSYTEGKGEGKAEVRFEAILQLMNNGFSKEKAMEILQFTADEAVEFEKWNK